MKVKGACFLFESRQHRHGHGRFYVALGSAIVIFRVPVAPLSLPSPPSATVCVAVFSAAFLRLSSHVTSRGLSLSQPNVWHPKTKLHRHAEAPITGDSYPGLLTYVVVWLHSLIIVVVFDSGN